MAYATYNTIINDVQTRIYTLLSTDTNTITLTTPAGESITGFKLSDLKWLDGTPKLNFTSTGQMYGIVHTPELAEVKITTSKHKVDITTTIELIGTREGHVRQVADLVRHVLNDCENTPNFIGSHIVNKEMPTTNLVITPSDKGVIYTYQIFVRHQFYGS